MQIALFLYYTLKTIRPSSQYPIDVLQNLKRLHVNCKFIKLSVIDQRICYQKY